jgi:hypothetical protein
MKPAAGFTLSRMGAKLRYCPGIKLCHSEEAAHELLTLICCGPLPQNDIHK